MDILSTMVFWLTMTYYPMFYLEWQSRFLLDMLNERIHKHCSNFYLIVQSHKLHLTLRRATSHTSQWPWPWLWEPKWNVSLSEIGGIWSYDIYGTHWYILYMNMRIFCYLKFYLIMIWCASQNFSKKLEHFRVRVTPKVHECLLHKVYTSCVDEMWN